MKVLVGGISHESNTFSNAFTGRQEFEASQLASGDDVPRLFLGTNTEVGGFLGAAKALGIEPACSLVARAEPSGPVVRGTYEEFKEWILADLRRARFDGVYLALHGAMTVQGLGDGEGDLLRVVREVVGPKVPVVATLDLHTLLTDAMLECADALIVYKTYPHVDMADRAAEAARLLARIGAGEVRPVAGCRRLPLLAPPTRMRTDAEPMASVGRRMVEMETAGQALSASFNHTFAYSDFPYTGAAALVYADGDRSRADELAGELADQLWERRALLRHEPTSVIDAVARALAHRSGPVVIADSADNPGGGSASDSVEIARELIRQGAESAAIGSICDPGAVALCHKAGVGAQIDLRVGGKVDRLHGDPLDATGVVEWLGDGHFTYRGPMKRGTTGDLGRTALLRVGGVRLVLAERRVQNWDPEIFRCVGVEPTEQRILVVKSVVHFRAAYEPLASLIVECDGPGTTALDLRRFPFRRVQRPIFGLDDI